VILNDDNKAILPNLRDWSDVVYLDSIAMDQVRYLEQPRILWYVLRANIGNGHTLAIIERALIAHQCRSQECPL
jgi:hypothetical protein